MTHNHFMDNKKIERILREATEDNWVAGFPEGPKTCENCRYKKIQNKAMYGILVTKEFAGETQTWIHEKVFESSHDAFEHILHAIEFHRKLGSEIIEPTTYVVRIDHGRNRGRAHFTHKVFELKEVEDIPEWMYQQDYRNERS